MEVAKDFSYPFLNVFSVCSTKAFIQKNVKTSLKALFIITALLGIF